LHLSRPTHHTGEWVFNFNFNTEKRVFRLPPLPIMRYCFFIVLLFLGFQTQTNAQVITTKPEFPTADDSVTIYFDATRGDQGLMDYTGDVYAHTGVITDQSNNSSDWKYVVTQWPNNIPKIKMTRVSTNLYKLNIGPSIRDFYGVPQAEKIKKMAFVFRNSDGSQTGRDTGGADIFADVYQNNFNIKFLQPADSLSFLGNTDSLSITGIGGGQNSRISLTLSINNQQVKQVNNDTLKYTFKGQPAGRYHLRLSGTDSVSSDTATSTVVVNPQITNQPRPAGLKDGITYVDNSTVRLSLFAPHKQFVYLLGDFNGWKSEPQYFMNRDSVNADSVYYWTEIDNLTPGQEYAFQYLVDGKIRVADPYSHKILDPNNDQYISDATYPNLKPYPKGKTDKIVGVLQPGKTSYNWQNLNYKRPAKDSLTVYELLIRDFVKNHDYKTLTDTLDYLDRLGINAIELMPVTEFEGNISWGYNPTFHLATDKYYGPADDLKKFVDACHARGIAVILDMVLNHVYGPSPLVRLWNEGDYGKPTPENPYLNVQSPNQTFSFGYDFNHESKATQYYVDRVNNYWLQNFHVDGFRFDFTKGFTQTPGDGFAYDASRIKILERMANHIWSVDDSAYVILEHFTANSEEKVLSNYGMMLWGNLNSSYNEATMGYNDSGKSDFSGVYYGNRGWNDPHLVGYMESHDEQRLMYKNLQYGNSSSDGLYDIKNLPTALNRVKMAGAFFFTVPGPKMIWQFGELGYDISIDQNGRTGEKPIKWNYFSDSDRKKLYKTYQALIKLRNASPAFTSDSSNVTMDVGSAAKRITIDYPNMDVSIIGNFGVTATTEKPNFAQSGAWYDYFSGDTLNVANPDTGISLQAGEFHIYTTKKFKTPETNLLPYDSWNQGSNGGNLSVKFLQPNQDPVNIKSSDSLSVVGASSNSNVTLSLAINQVQVAQVNSDTLRYTFKGHPAGSYKLTLIGNNSASTDTVSTMVVVGAVTNQFKLYQNYPNPFNPTTTIPYNLPDGVKKATISIYDILGRLVEKKQISSDNPYIEFDASNLSSGVYIYRLKAGNRTLTKKMMLIK